MAEKKLKPYLFTLKPKGWKNFFWKINTATKILYKSQYGASDTVKGKITRVIEKNGAPAQIEVQLEDFNLVFSPKNKSLQLISGGNVLSYCKDWKVSQISSGQYHLAKENWRDFFWLVDTDRRSFYEVKKGKFGRPGGRQKYLEAGVTIK